MPELGSDFYRATLSLVRLGLPPLQALQTAARRRGTIVAVPERLAEFLGTCTTGEAVALIERVADRAAEREKYQAS
jgi:hypothetical protein